MKMLFRAALAAGAMLVSSAALADTVAYNSTPADGWFFGNGNDYSPANTAVSTLANGDQIYLRMHQTYQTAPASTGNGVYSFALGTDPISFDWGVDESFGALLHASALITLTNLGTGATATVVPFFFINDNATGNGSTQNSYRLNWAAFGFDKNVDNAYKVEFAIADNQLNWHKLDVTAVLGAGVAAVPEPATWAMLLLGFGAIGVATRRSRTPARSLA